MREIVNGKFDKTAVKGFIRVGLHMPAAWQTDSNLQRVDFTLLTVNGIAHARNETPRESVGDGPPSGVQLPRHRFRPECRRAR